MLLFGGLAIQPSGTTMQDTWTVDLGTGAWSYAGGELCPLQLRDGCSGVPERRTWHSLLIDRYNRLVLFGGYYPDSPTFSNVWVSDNGGGYWNHLGEAPNVPADYKRGFHSASYDPIGQRMVVVGG